MCSYTNPGSNSTQSGFTLLTAELRKRRRRIYSRDMPPVGRLAAWKAVCESAEPVAIIRRSVETCAEMMPSAAEIEFVGHVALMPVQTLEPDATNIRGVRQRLSYVFCDASETCEHREAPLDAGSEDTPQHEPPAPSTLSVGVSLPSDPMSGKGRQEEQTWPRNDPPPEQENKAGTADKCVSVRILFPADAPGSVPRREKGSQRRKVVPIEHLMNKGFLKHNWMHRMRTERPSCLILCFDWRHVYDVGVPSCCGCCRKFTAPVCSEGGPTPQACGSEVVRCCTRNGCLRPLEPQQEDVSSLGEHGDAARTPRGGVPPLGVRAASSAGNPPSSLQTGASKMPGVSAEIRRGAKGREVAAAEAEAMATIEFFREKLQRRMTVPKMIVFVILPAGMEDPQSAVGFLKKLNPADIAAIFITCGVDDLKTKLEKLEQVCFECSGEYYENEARRYRKQTQVTFKGDRSQTSAFHVYQTRGLIKAGYMLEFGQQPHAAMKNYITAWQFLTGYPQMAPALERMTVCNLISVRMYPMYFKAKEPAKAAHHAREHRAVLRENLPESPLQGYLLPLWLAQLHQLLAELCEDAMQADASSLDTRDVWQLAGFHYQAAARYLQQVRIWIRTAKTANPPPSMKGGLGMPSEWLGRPNTLQHGIAAFTTSSAPEDEAAAAAAAQEEVFLRFIFFFNEAQVLTHATHLLSKAHIAYKLVGGCRSCPILACELADAMFDGHRMMTARQLYFTLATAFASKAHGNCSSWQLEGRASEAESGVAGVRSPQQQHKSAQGCREEGLENQCFVSARLSPSHAPDADYGPSTYPVAVGSRPSDTFSPPALDDSQLPVEGRIRLLGPTKNTGWWPLYWYVLARLTLCVSYLLSVPPAKFLFEAAHVDPHFSSAVGESASNPPSGEEGQQSLPPPGPSKPCASSLYTGAVVSAGPVADAESCRVALKASFEMLNILALRENLDDPCGAKRSQMAVFIAQLLPFLRPFEQPQGGRRWLFHVNLHAVVIWTDFSSELHFGLPLSGSRGEEEAAQRESSRSLEEAAQQAGTGGGGPIGKGLLIGRVCFQHRLGCTLVVLRNAELVTTRGNTAACHLEAVSSSATQEEENHALENSAEGAFTDAVGGLTLSHGVPSCFDVYLNSREVREISGSTLRAVRLSWASCPSVCFQLATVCSLEKGSSSCRPRGAVAEASCDGVVPRSCWPPSIQRAARFHNVCTPLPPLCDIERPALAEPCLPSLRLFKNSLQLSVGAGALSKYVWIGELAPFAVQLAIQQSWTAFRFSIGVQCSALASGGDPPAEGSSLLEDVFEAYVLDGATAALTDSQTETRPPLAEVLFPADKRGLLGSSRLLRVPTRGVAGLPFAVSGSTGVRLASGSGQETANSDREAAPAFPLVLDLSDQQCNFVHANAEAGSNNEQPEDALAQGGRRDASRGGNKVFCIPMLIRLRRAGTFEICVTVDVAADGIIQKLTTRSVVECQRSVEASFTAVSFPLVEKGGRPRDARCISITNVSSLPLQLTSVELLGLAEHDIRAPTSPATFTQRRLALTAPEMLPCCLLPNESWSGLAVALDATVQHAVRLKYSRTPEDLPLPFRCLDGGITENLSVVRLPEIIKSVSLQYLQIALKCPTTACVGVPFAFSAAFENLTREAMELAVSLSYRPDGAPSSDTGDSGGRSFVSQLPDCPFMIGGTIRTQIIILPRDTTVKHWTLVPSRPGSFALPTVLVEGKVKPLGVESRRGPAAASEVTSDNDGQAHWECASDSARVVVFSKT
ncbi:hypothetical protein cyc_02518 [Cyclospora cayetanensis]|uniref:Uncharacterized protein n=1 Tax=Cyclospora cayetanensis TaxID=88456 RepID=A0A1D3D9L7_9EIME|nr:hypothetical protein cyc_02518 [Cyclospora cayetanensis]